MAHTFESYQGGRLTTFEEPISGSTPGPGYLFPSTQILGKATKTHSRWQRETDGVTVDQTIIEQKNLARQIGRDPEHGEITMVMTKVEITMADGTQYSWAVQTRYCESPGEGRVVVDSYWNIPIELILRYMGADTFKKLIDFTIA